MRDTKIGWVSTLGLIARQLRRTTHILPPPPENNKQLLGLPSWDRRQENHRVGNFSNNIYSIHKTARPRLRDSASWLPTAAWASSRNLYERICTKHSRFAPLQIGLHPRGAAALRAGGPQHLARARHVLLAPRELLRRHGVPRARRPLPVPPLPPPGVS